MDAPWVIAILTFGATVIGSLITAVAGPSIYPWFEERLSRGRLRVQRRIQVRQMIENELAKGFQDLSVTGGYLGTRDLLQAGALEAYLKGIIANEQAFGAWLPYKVQDKSILKTCEEFRIIIENIRVGVVKPEITDEAVRLAKARTDADRMATEIVAKMDGLGW